jgi:AcrR family transcriptional regulator
VDAIVEAAGRLLVEHGRLGVTTNAVAERAGVSIGSLYQYFPNKEAIFAALQERHRDQVMPLVQHTLARLADPGLDMVDVLVGLMRAMADLHADAPARLRAISEELREETSGAEIQSFAEATTRILATRFSRTQDSVRPMAWLACVTLGNVGRTLVHHPPALDVEQLLTALAGMLRGLFATR